MDIKWRLRMAAAQREVWTGAQLRRLLRERAGLELSSASVSALLSKTPAQVKLSTLAALCTRSSAVPTICSKSTPRPSVPRPRPPRRLGSRPRWLGGGRCRRYERPVVRGLRSPGPAT